MCSINHEMKAIYLHIPKNGGLFIQNILEKYYGFKTLYFTRSDHYLFDDYKKEEYNKENYKFISNGFINIKKFGIFNYYKTSQEHNDKMNMDDEKWNTYYKFTFVRDPYTKIISAYKYLVKDSFIDLKTFIDKKDELNNYIYTHAFITQYEHMIDENYQINFNKIGRFENLNEDLIDILFEIGFDKIKHGGIIKKNIKVNSTNCSSYNDFYDQDTLNKVNILFNIDFETFNYNKFLYLEEFNNYYDTFNNNFESKNRELYNKLLNLNKFFDYDNLHIDLGNVQINIDDDDDDDINTNNLYDDKFVIGNYKKNKDKYLKTIIHKLFNNLKPIDKDCMHKKKKIKKGKDKKILEDKHNLSQEEIKKYSEEEMNKIRKLNEKINNSANDYFKIEKQCSFLQENNFKHNNSIQELFLNNNLSIKLNDSTNSTNSKNIKQKLTYEEVQFFMDKLKNLKNIKL